MSVGRSVTKPKEVPIEVSEKGWESGGPGTGGKSEDNMDPGSWVSTVF